MAITGVFDAVVAYQFVKLLSQPFNEWKAYELGIIDEEGKSLKKRSSLKSQQEKNSFTTFHVVVRNLKKIMEKMPGGKSKLVSFAAALFLLKEEHNKYKTKEQLQERLQQILESNDTKRWFMEYQVREEYLAEDMSAATTTSDVALVDTPMNFAGNKVFKVPSNVFVKARMGKKKYDKWYNYVGEAENAEEIRLYGVKNPKAAVILQDATTGAMMYLRYGKR